MLQALEMFRHAARSLLRTPAHTLLIVGTLAVGIAASTSVFSVMNPYLLRPLPYADAGSLIQIEQVEPVRGATWVRFSLPQWRDWQAAARSLEDVAAYRYNQANLTGEGPAERLMVSWTTGNAFAVLGARPLRGRTFTASEAGPGAEPVVVLSHGLWAGRFGSDEGIIGRTIRLDGVEHTVLGVMPPDFTFPWNEVKAWIPERAPEAWTDRGRMSFLLIGRLAEGWTAARAEGDLARVQRELGAAHAEVDGRYEGLNIRHLREALNFGYDAVRIGFAVLLGAVGLLLLIACVNVAALMLARATGRSREMAVRRALGAGRTRLAGQLLAESALLALVGGAAGLALAWGVVAWVGARLPEDLFRVGTASLDGRVVAFALGLTTLTPLLFGLSPALDATRVAPADALRSGARAGDRTGVRRRKGLVVVQVALAVVLASMTSLLGRSFLAVQGVETGFDAERVLIAEATPPAAEYPAGPEVDAFFARAEAALRAVPGVGAVGLADRLPLNHETYRAAYGAGTGDLVPESWPTAILSAVSPGYFEAIGTPLLEGRGFSAADGPESGPVVIVSRSLADRAWPGETAVGRTIRVPEGDTTVALAVVGVAGDVRWTDLTSAPEPHLYRPLAQTPARRRFLVAATTGGVPPGELTTPVREALAAAAPTVPVGLRPMTRLLRESDFQWAVSALAVGVFGGIALMLAALGIYGLIAYTVALRRREIGIRAALGAEAAAIRALIVGQGVRLAVGGLLIGLALALVAGRVVEGFLYGVRPADPLTIAGVGTLFLAVAVAASRGPAGRATRVQPAEVLRQE